MKPALRLLREHRGFLLISTVLTLVMTFPTIIYIFRTDVFWLPAGNSSDVFFHFWDAWHVKRVLSGQSELFFTNALFYPKGLPLVYQSFLLPHAIVVNALQIAMPVSNAFCLAYLLIILSSALSAYVYLLYLFDDKWTALFGALVFGLSPHVVGRANTPIIAFVAPLPLVLYFFHRGLGENRFRLLVAAGILTGLTCATSLYAYACLLMTLGLGICGFAWTRWRYRRFWLNVVLLMAVIGLASSWRILPIMQSPQSLSDALVWHGTGEGKNDFISFVVNHNHPVMGPLLESILQTPDNAKLSTTSYLGYLPLLLIGIGLSSARFRRPMLPWLILGCLFALLRLGSTLRVNGTEYGNILLPKHILGQVFPFAFSAFGETDLFMFGLLTPLAVLSCYGLAALQQLQPATRKTGFVLLLIALLAVEYFVPVKEKIYPAEQFAFLEWLAREPDSEEIRLVNLPMGRKNSKRYGFYQSLSGYPQVEGASNRTALDAYSYINQNSLLHSWSKNRPITCETFGQDIYHAELKRLEDDGFSYVVYHHRWMINFGMIADSFRNAEPSYSDEYVSIFRLEDLRKSCSN